MLLNQTDVAVDEELEKVIITSGSSTVTDFCDYESAFEYSSGGYTETSNETKACLGFRHTIPNDEI